MKIRRYPPMNEGRGRKVMPAAELYSGSRIILIGSGQYTAFTAC